VRPPDCQMAYAPHDADVSRFRGHEQEREDEARIQTLHDRLPWPQIPTRIFSGDGIDSGLRE
jgi:hypothetical protein